MYLVAPPVARRGVKRSSRSRIADSAGVRGRDLVQDSEVTHSNEYVVTRNFSRLTLYRVSKCHSGLSGDTENRSPARSRRCLIQKTVRPFCPSPTSTKVQFLAACYSRTNFRRSEILHSGTNALAIVRPSRN